MRHIYLLIILSFGSSYLLSQTMVGDSVWNNQLRTEMIQMPRLTNYNDTVWVEQHFEKRTTKFECGVYFEVDLISTNFNEFQTSLKSYNTKLLNLSNTPFIWGISANYKHFTLGLQYGSRNEENSDHDSLKIKLNKSIYGINFGYNIIDTKHWVVSPLVSLKWYRYRLSNGQKNNEISLDDYLENPNLDIRMNQAIGITGINIAYKLYKFSPFPCDFWTVGLKGGYPFKLHDKPFVFSKENRLTSDYKINYGKYYFTFYFSFNLKAR